MMTVQDFEDMLIRLVKRGFTPSQISVVIDEYNRQGGEYWISMRLIQAQKA